MGRQEPARDPNREQSWDITPKPGPEVPPQGGAERRGRGPGEPSEGPAVPWPEGAPARGPFPSYTQPGRTNGKAIASLIIGIVGLFFLPIILSAVAIIVGWVALSDIERKPPQRGRGLAIAGIVIGVIGLIIGIISLIVAASYNWMVG